MTLSTTDDHTTLAAEAVILRHLADTADQLLSRQPWLTEDCAEAYALLQSAAAAAEASVALLG